MRKALELFFTRVKESQSTLRRRGRGWWRAGWELLHADLSPFGRSTPITLGTQGTVTVGGRAVFPLGLYYADEELNAESPEALRELAALGFNCIQLRSDGPVRLKRDLRRCADAGLFAMVRPRGELTPHDAPTERALAREVRVTRRAPSLLFWEYADEPFYNGIALKDARRGRAIVKKLDPLRPMAVVHWPGSLEWLHLWDELAEVVGVDLYPFPACHGYGNLADRSPSQVFRVVAELRQRFPQKTILAVLQAWNPDPIRYGTHGYPTVEQSRFMAYSAIAAGASGLFYFGQRRLRKPNPALGLAPRSDDEWRAMTALNEAFWRGHDRVIEELRSTGAILADSRPAADLARVESLSEGLRCTPFFDARRQRPWCIVLNPSDASVNFTVHFAGGRGQPQSLPPWGAARYEYGAE